MRDAVLAALPGQHVYISAAAIADYMPAETQPRKIKKSAQSLTLELVRTPDILSEVAAHPQRPSLVVGFAAETDDVEKHARGKLQAKALDLIAANDVSVAGIGFESEDNALTVFSADGRHELPRGSKRLVARELLTLIAGRLEAKA